MSDTNEVKEVERAIVRNTGEYSNLLDSVKFEHLQRVATVFSKSKLVPKHFQGDMASVFIVLQWAFRAGVDPFMMLQGTYVVHGRPGIEAKLAIAMVNTKGPFTGPIEYRLEGQGLQRKCTAYATHRLDGKIREGVCTMQIAKDKGWIDKDGSNWRSMPDLMLQYRSAMFLARLHCPEVLYGLSTKEELEDITPETGIIHSHTRIVDEAPKPISADLSTEPGFSPPAQHTIDIVFTPQEEPPTHLTGPAEIIHEKEKTESPQQKADVESRKVEVEAICEKAMGTIKKGRMDALFMFAEMKKGDGRTYKASRIKKFRQLVEDEIASLTQPTKEEAEEYALTTEVEMLLKQIEIKYGAKGEGALFVISDALKLDPEIKTEKDITPVIITKMREYFHNN